MHEQEHEDQLLTNDAAYQKERNFLKAKIDTLNKQVLALRASSSTGRRLLYWSTMKNKHAPGANEDAGPLWSDHSAGQQQEKWRPASAGPRSNHVADQQHERWRPSSAGSNRHRYGNGVLRQ